MRNEKAPLIYSGETISNGEPVTTSCTVGSGLAVWNSTVTARSTPQTVGSSTSRKLLLLLSPFAFQYSCRKMVCACFVTILLVLYILFDVNYFLRIIFTIGIGRLLQKRTKIFDTTAIYGICTTQDVDLFLKHMNNARYLRELDFARFHYYDRSGIYAAIAKRGGGAVQGASSTRYRRAIPIFTPYKVTTKLIYWEDKHFYLEHEFVSLFDGFVRAVVLSRQTVTGLKCPVSEIIAEVEPNSQLPGMPKDLQLWINSMEESSQKYKKQS